MTFRITLLVLLAQIVLFHIVVAQETSERWRIETSDGNIYIGTIDSEDEASITLITEAIGRITIQRTDIDLMIKLDDNPLAEPLPFGPESTRYFWAPSGHGLARGQGYFQNVWVLFNQVSMGVTDNFSVGIGTIPLFLFAGQATPIWFTPKISFPLASENVKIGAGALVATVLGVEGEGSAGIAYGVLTFGSREKNVTAGVGYGFADGEWANTPLITISFINPVGRNGYFLGENYFVVSGDEVFVLSMVGGRRKWERFSLDFGGVLPLGSGFSELVVIPWLGFRFPIGR